MRSVGKFIESEVGSSSRCWTQQRDDHPEHELELCGEAAPGSRGGGNRASRDGLKILRLSPGDAANRIRRRIDGKRILLVIDDVLRIRGKVVKRQAVSHHLREHSHRGIAVGDLAPKHLSQDGREFLRREQIWTSGPIRLSGVSFWPRENLSHHTGHIFIGRRRVEARAIGQGQQPKLCGERQDLPLVVREKTRVDEGHGGSPEKTKKTLQPPSVPGCGGGGGWMGSTTGPCAHPLPIFCNTE